MSDAATLWLADEQSTQYCGSTLARSLYDLPVDILLTGDLGAGKTSFIQGFAMGLGISERVVSPTFALEQHYEASDLSTPFVHIDLYRLTAKQAERQLQATDDHTGIRCIEWPSVYEGSFGERTIEIRLEELSGRLGRHLEITFRDAALPSRNDIESWRASNYLPPHISDHCDAVAEMAIDLCTILLKRGTIVRPLLLRRSAEVHDLLRFLDFRPGGYANQEETSPEQKTVWDQVRTTFPGLKHEPACAAFLERRGFHALAEIVKVHGLCLPSPERRSIEQQLLFYADKRVMLTKRVSLEERFADFRNRYGSGAPSTEGDLWLREARSIEQALFPDGCPL